MPDDVSRALAAIDEHYEQHRLRKQQASVAQSTTHCPDGYEHVWSRPTSPLTASNLFCQRCGYFPGPAVNNAIGNDARQLA